MSPLLVAFQFMHQPVSCTAELVTDVRTVRAGTPFWVGLRLTPTQGAHTYWQNPGDSGMATSMVWKLPAGWKADAIQWPVPERISLAGLVSYGYTKEVLLLTRITPPLNAPPGTQVLRADASWLVCREECISGTKTLTLPVQVVSSQEAKVAPASAPCEKAARTLPAPLPPPYQATATLDGKSISLRVNGPNVPTDFAFYPLDVIVDVDAPQSMTYTKDGATLQLGVSQYATGAPPRLRGLLVAPTGQRWPNGAQAVLIDIALQNEQKP